MEHTVLLIFVYFCMSTYSVCSHNGRLSSSSRDFEISCGNARLFPESFLFKIYRKTRMSGHLIFAFNCGFLVSPIVAVLWWLMTLAQDQSYVLCPSIRSIALNVLHYPLELLLVWYFHRSPRLSLITCWVDRIAPYVSYTLAPDRFVKIINNILSLRLFYMLRKLFNSAYHVY